MPDKSYFPWPRYWLSDESKDSFVQNGYLTLPLQERSRYLSAVPSKLSELIHIPVLILLGDPGYGKSRALNDEYERLKSENSDDQVIYCDLKGYGNGDQESLKKELLDKRKHELVVDSRKLWVLLDGLDECGIHEPAYWLKNNFINQIDQPERVFVRITCRVSFWPEFLETAFSERWRSITEKPVEKWRLCPLREEDVRIAAQNSEINPEVFLSTISDRNVAQLAALPVTLIFMLGLFRENKLPEKRAEIFEKGLELLCEDSPERRKLQLKSEIPVKTRFLTAARIALGYILQGNNGVWYGSSLNFPTGMLNSKEITGKEEDEEINERAISETLELTGIFSRFDEQRFEFASRTFAEFLTAWYLSKSPVPITQKLKLMLHPESQRLIPDLFETASWLAALDPKFLDWLVKQEPEAALQADYAILSQADLPSLVDGLLNVAAKEHRPAFDVQKLHKLNYPGLDAKLAIIISDNTGSLAPRCLAIRIAAACKLFSLGSELVDLALNNQEGLEIRKLAISYTKLMDDEIKLRLLPLALSDDDPSLKANALSVVKPAIMGVDVFFNQIPPEFLEKSDFELRYVVEEDDFFNFNDASNIKIGLEWIAKHTPFSLDQFTSIRLKDRILSKAFDFLYEPEVLQSLVFTMIKLRRHHDDYPDTFRRRQTPNPLDDIEKRHVFIAGLFKQLDTKEVWSFFCIDCFREEDGVWLCQQWDNASSDSERRVIAETFSRFIDRYQTLDVIEYVLTKAGHEVKNPDPILSEHLAWLVKPTDLACDAIINQRKQYFEHKALSQNVKENRKIQNNVYPPEFYIQNDLNACEQGDFNRWTNLVSSLGLQDDCLPAFPYRPDVLPGWCKADQALRNRIKTVAISYLAKAAPAEDHNLLQNTNRSNYIAGGLAVSILVATDSLESLSVPDLMRWCFATVSHPFDHIETQVQIFRKIRSIAPEAFDAAVLKVADIQANGGFLYLLQSCRDFWHPAFLTLLLDTKLKEQTWPFSCRLTLAEILMDHDGEKVAAQLVEWLADETDSSNQTDAAIALFRYALSQTKVWSVMQRMLDSDETFARSVISKTAHPSGYSTVIDPNLNTPQLGWLFEKVAFLFPPKEDEPTPNGIYEPSPRHNIADFRSRIMDKLLSSGTVDAVKEIDRICSVLPEELWLLRVRADAYKALMQRERTQISFAETIQLLSNPDLTVVRNSRELMVVVEEALLRFAEEVQHGSPPLAIFLWNESQKTPISEQRLSDFLKFYLNREWRNRRIIINREVEIKNWRNSGIGERTDLLIEAFLPNGNSNQPHPCVVIEVKPDKKAKPKKDIPNQLVEKYLDGVSRNRGIYLVGWFGKSRLTLEEICNDADQQALKSTNDKVTVHSMVLDLSHPIDVLNQDASPIPCGGENQTAH